MDADDVALPHRLERQVHFLAQFPHVDVVGSAVQRLDARAPPLLAAAPPPACAPPACQSCASGLRVVSLPQPPALVAWSMLWYCSLAHPTVLMRVAAVREVGGYGEGAASP